MFPRFFGSLLWLQINVISHILVSLLLQLVIYGHFRLVTASRTPTAFCHSSFAAESPFLPRGKGGRTDERFLLPSFLFFCSTGGGGLMWPTRRGKSPILQISYGKYFIKLNPFPAPFHEIFECLLMVLAGKLNSLALSFQAPSHGSKGLFHFLLF